MRVDGRVLGGDRKLIHNVYILDGSGSMAAFGKYEIACSGINTELEMLRSESSVDYTQTIIEFDSSQTYSPFGLGHFGGTDHKTEIVTHCFMKPLNEVGKFVGRGPRGGTPLFQTVGETVDRFINAVKGDERVLIKIFTDGEENTSSGLYKNPAVLHDLIERAKNVNKFAITFVGTDKDVERMVADIGINRSNTFAHQNDACSVDKAFRTMTRGTALYATATAGGASAESLTKGFFDKADVSITPKKDEEKQETKNNP